MRILIAALALCLCASAALAEPGDVYSAYQSGDYAPALRMFQQQANQGISGAQFGLGVMYANGRGVPQDYAEAMKWYRKAADQGDTISQFNLGVN